MINIDKVGVTPVRNETSVNLGNLLLSLSDAIDLADASISQHQLRTAYIAWELGKELSMSADDLINVFIAALFHDIGAVTIDEKISLHNFEADELHSHCDRGELLLKRVPLFSNVALIVKYHHTEWGAWKEPFENKLVMASQIILLSDYVERLIKREIYILHQSEQIIETIHALSGKLYHSKLFDIFSKISKREEFWLDINSPRLYSLLFHNGPLKSVEIKFSEIELISKFFRDIIDFKSRFTATHTSGVSASAVFLATKFGFTGIEILDMKIAGNLHDIGKLIIPNSILDKPDNLTKEEMAIIKSHTFYSYYVINSINGSRYIAEWAAYHHEKLNGTGYPFRCGENEITTGSRIMTVADIFTALAEDRPYRKGLHKTQITAILNDMVDANAVDARIVKLLIDNYNEIDDYVKLVQDAAHEFYSTRFLAIS